MAYAAVASLVQTLKPIIDYDNLHLDLYKKQQIESLLEKACRLQVFLEDSSFVISNEAVQCLEPRIRDVAYRAEDLIESFASKLHASSSFVQKIKSILQNLECVFWPGNMRSIIQETVEEIDSITKEVMKIKEEVEKDELPRSSLPEITSSMLPAANSSVKNMTMVGFDEGLMQLKDRLTNQQFELQIIPIVGMGGIGKTTLARNIYNDPLIVYQFDTRAWVTISQEYCLREVLLRLLDCTTKLTDEMRNETDGELATHLYKSLKGRRYLIVIDDVWSTNAWDDVKLLFPNDNNGSRIMLTTRLSNVAVYVESYRPNHHQMHFLNEHESWNLLREKVFLGEHCPSELEKIGIRIAQNCRGLPLTIVVIGGLLSKLSRTRDIWEHIANNVSSFVMSNDEQCLKILSLSYNYLSHHLKPCFLYMGAFREDSEIRVSKLIKLWAAEGFLNPTRSKPMEEIALENLQDLIDRNLILVYQQGSNGKIKSCVIHDLLREICMRECHIEKFMCVKDIAAESSLFDMNGQRRVSIFGNNNVSSSHLQSIIDDLLKTMPHARSCRFIGRVPYTSDLSLGFRLLRVLDVSEIHYYPFPKEILQLCQLRYLAFKFKGRIPSSISELENLQTLIIHGVSLFKLPLEVFELPRLKHLFTTRALPYPAFASIDRSVSLFGESLETLSVVPNFICSENILKRVQNIKKLGIKYEYVNSEEEWSCFHLNNLSQLHKLENLKCIFGICNLLKSSCRKFYPPKLTFPPNITKLTLIGSCLPWKDMTVIGSLPNLQVLKLCEEAFKGHVWEPIEGEFLLLKYLKLEEMNLLHWTADYTHFPSLECLILKQCRRFQEIPSVIGEIPTLRLIELDSCCQSAVTSANNIKEEQQSFGNDGLEVRIQYTWSRNNRWMWQ